MADNYIVGKNQRGEIANPMKTHFDSLEPRPDGTLPGPDWWTEKDLISAESPQAAMDVYHRRHGGTLR